MSINGFNSQFPINAFMPTTQAQGVNNVQPTSVNPFASTANSNMAPASLGGGMTGASNPMEALSQLFSMLAALLTQMLGGASGQPGASAAGKAASLAGANPAEAQQTGNTGNAAARQASTTTNNSAPADQSVASGDSLGGLAQILEDLIAKLSQNDGEAPQADAEENTPAPAPAPQPSPAPAPSYDTTPAPTPAPQPAPAPAPAPQPTPAPAPAPQPSPTPAPSYDTTPAPAPACQDEPASDHGVGNGNVNAADNGSTATTNTNVAGQDVTNNNNTYNITVNVKRGKGKKKHDKAADKSPAPAPAPAYHTAPTSAPSHDKKSGGDIASNNTNVANGGDIASNNTNVANGEGDIASNNTNVTNGEGDIASNNTNVANQGDIASNNANVTGKGDIASNNTNVTHGGDIASNNTNVTGGTEDCEPTTPPPAYEDGNDGSYWGDPHFIGFGGEKYDVMGEVGKTYNILSDKDVQYNAEFAAWGKPGADGVQATVIGKAGLQVGNSKVEIDRSGTAPSVDGKTMEANKDYTLDNDGSAKWDGKKLTVKTREYTTNLEVKDHKDGTYIDSDVKINEGVNPLADGTAAHGILGQTADGVKGERKGVNNTGVEKQGGTVIDGTVKDYEVKDVHDTSFEKNNRFTG